MVSLDQVVRVPENLSLKELAGVPMAGSTAWLALCKEGKIKKKGDKVLVNGGSSGVGHLAIQIAKACGAEVTSISSTNNLSLCKKLGADYAIDYLDEDFTKSDKKFDIVFDVVFTKSFEKTKHLLTVKGIYIGTTPSLQMIKELLFSRRTKFVVVKSDKKVLSNIVSLIGRGKMIVRVDKVFSLCEVTEAHVYIEKGRTKGKVLIEMGKVEDQE